MLISISSTSITVYIPYVQKERHNLDYFSNISESFDSKYTLDAQTILINRETRGSTTGKDARDFSETIMLGAHRPSLFLREALTFS